MTQKQFGKKLAEAMKKGAVTMSDGSKIYYHNGRYITDRYFSVYDKNGNCVDTGSATTLYYLYR